jgi:hypothetical protein
LKIGGPVLIRFICTIYWAFKNLVIIKGWFKSPLSPFEQFDTAEKGGGNPLEDSQESVREGGSMRRAGLGEVLVDGVVVHGLAGGIFRISRLDAKGVSAAVTVGIFVENRPGVHRAYRRRIGGCGRRKGVLVAGRKGWNKRVGVIPAHTGPKGMESQAKEEKNHTNESLFHGQPRFGIDSFIFRLLTGRVKIVFFGRQPSRDFLHTG